MENYFTIEQTSTAEYKDRGSKFLAFVFPMSESDEIKKVLMEVKKNHPKAVHHCFAYRLGIDGNQFRVNDDGEPSGSAGKPILGQIDSKKLTNLGIIVTRYFGGTLLGVPGLINAYRTAAALCLQTIPIVQKPVLVKYQLEFDYNAQNEVMQIIKQCQCQIIKSEINLFSVITIGVPKSRENELVFRMKDIYTSNLKKILF
jgi:uncharacterized YigZ family protein